MCKSHLTGNSTTSQSVRVLRNIYLERYIDCHTSGCVVDSSELLVLCCCLLQDPGPIILNTESLVQLSQVVEFDLDAVVSVS